MLQSVGNRAHVAQGAVQTLPVVEHLDVVEDIPAQCGHLLVLPPKDVLLLHAGEEALHTAVVIRVSRLAHAASDPVVLKHLLISPAAVLTPPVAVKHQRFRPPIPRNRVAQRLAGQFRIDLPADRVSDHLPVVQVYHNRQIHPSQPGPEIGDIPCPNLIGLRRAELLLHHVLAVPPFRLSAPAGLVFPLLFRIQAVFPHDPPDAPFTHDLSAILQRLPHPSASICSMVLLKNLFHGLDVFPLLPDPLIPPLFCFLPAAVR